MGINIFDQIRIRLRKKPYFLIIGAGRGGTSLLASMLDYHPELEVGFESFAFDYLLGQKLSPKKRRSLRERLDHFNRSCQYQANLSRHYWGNKITTEQIATLEECEGAGWPRYVKAFQQTAINTRKVVFIIRDGRTCIRSKMKRTGQSYQVALARWKRSIEIMEYLKQAGVEMLICRYEDLLQEPRKELERVCKFLNKAFDHRMLEGPSNPKMPKIYQEAGGIRQASGAEKFPAEWLADIQEELQKLGYLSEDK